MARDVLLIDFGGVLTTSVFDAFGAFCEGHGLPPTRFVDLLTGEDPAAARLLVEVETGARTTEAFERDLAPLLGPAVPAEGLIAGLTAALRPDEEVLAAVLALRAAGVRTVLVSNAMGPVPYVGLDTDALFDAVVLSDELGVRKPSRRIYEHALALVDAAPQDAVFVDDLAANCRAAERLGILPVHHVDSRETVATLEEAFGVPLGAAAA
ncbi:HAD-IA family hydrolase [Patulibacter brassicae]|uniref:HAD-IA family hydrolase n=1 Tax=Patulibacter brassicae TaxID=1705717 RepID=A0ABU4VLM1_9ACTN|nr:HAD-IA family hydrolase [Patulibacter brassicae]MDX8152678.1 HAD-IA family hydrolase [Patulibacter brassicae]